MKPLLAVCALALAPLFAQHSNMMVVDGTLKVGPTSGSIVIIHTPASIAAELKADGDFTFYDKDGNVIAKLYRHGRGDQVQELMATILVNTVLQMAKMDGVKDWREHKEQITWRSW